MRFMILISIIFSLQAQAVSQEGVALNLKCVTQAPTTSYVAKTEGDKIYMSVVHHNGTAYMPIFNGNITPSDLPLLKEHSELLQKLGERIEITFDKANCNSYGSGLYSCGLGKVTSKTNVPVERASFLTKVVTESVFDVRFEKIVASVGVYIDSRYYKIENDFYFGTCKFE